MNEPETGIRLNKYLASCGIGSRRACDELIQKGGVVVNGKVCTDLSQRVTEDDFVKIENKRVFPKETTTILFNKPRGCVCTKNDELDRETIYEYLPPTLRHLNHVGRLDQDSEGLLVLTNDGEIAQTLTHPKLKVEKEYLVTVNQSFDNGVLDQFLKGIFIGKGMPRAKAKAIKRLSPRRFLVTLETGLKRQIRLMCKALHLNVVKLVRVRIGMVVGAGLESGRWTELDADDIKMLQTNPKPSHRLPGQRTLATTKKYAAKKTAKKAAKKTGRRTPSSRPSGKNTSSRKPSANRNASKSGPRSTPKSNKSYKRRR